MRTKSEQSFSDAKKYIVGGVNSPVRSFSGVGGNPIYFKHGDGAYLFDIDDNKYIDFVGSWGPMILGHANKKIINAITSTAKDGLSFGAPTLLETKLAKKICQLMPAIELLRMVNSGTEATMSAIRLARGYTARDKIIKFEGCYHGHSDSLLVKAGSGALTIGVPTSPGVPAVLAEQTITLTYNNSKQVRDIFNQIGNQIAAIIVEPIAGNMNLIPANIAFLQTLREVCSDSGAVLIFDEVMSGFRVALGGATELYNIKPDLITLGKIIGGGLPVGAFGGKSEIMQHLAPIGGVYQAGTLSGNPLAMAAGLSMLEQLSADKNLYKQLSLKTEKLITGIKKVAKNNNIAISSNNVGSMFGLFFSNENIVSFKQLDNCDMKAFKKFFHLMLANGVYFAPSAFEAGFVSSAHSDDDIDKVIMIADKIFTNFN